MRYRRRSRNRTGSSEDTRAGKKQKLQQTNESQDDEDRKPAAVSLKLSPNQKAIESAFALIKADADDAEQAKHTLRYLE